MASNQSICTAYAFETYSFNQIYAVPIFASSDQLSQSEEKNIYVLQFSPLNFEKGRYKEYHNHTITQYHEHSKDCLYTRCADFQRTPQNWSVDVRGDVSFIQENCNTLKEEIPKFSITSAYILRDVNTVLLISCDGVTTNVTVLLSCFKYWDESFDREIATRTMLQYWGMKIFELTPVNSEDRMRSFLNFVASYPMTISKKCPEPSPRNRRFIFIFYLLLPLALIISILIAFAGACKTNRVSQQRPT